MWQLLKEVPLKVDGAYRTVERTIYIYGKGTIENSPAEIRWSRHSPVEEIPRLDRYSKTPDIRTWSSDEADTSNPEWLKEIVIKEVELMKDQANRPSLLQAKDVLDTTDLERVLLRNSLQINR